ncbi:STAS domain-containing protein [Streptomyces sp. NPDC001089]
MTHEMAAEGVAVAVTVGELDVYTTRTWREYLLDVLDREVPRHLGLDFSRVGYFDSTAIGALVRCFKEFREAGEARGERMGVFALFSVQPRTAKLLRVTQLDRIFEVLGSREEFLGLASEADAEAGADSSV